MFWFLRGVFAHDIKVSDMLVESLDILGRIYVICSICLYVCLCDCSFMLFMVLCVTVLGFWGHGLSNKHEVAHPAPFSLFPRYESVGHYRAS